ncbi:MAG TPA: polyprenyl synthetase family protein [Candidatus Eremiobacteraceae bacterium]|nr:polyprenyl synthetase family protein [Candidatus Eremiobacteraceae bacterium]
MSNANPVYAQIAHHLGYVAGTPSRRGKRLRPRLLIAAAESCGGSIDAALPASVAVELLHNYSLVHDDIEDGDRMRHGRETVWSVFGLPHGVNTGDAVGALAQLALASVSPPVDDRVAFAMSMDLATANLRMCEGQSLDIAFERVERATVDAYVEMIGGKTAALFACCGSLGARSAGADAALIERCADVGRLFGIAFQIQDDVIGTWGDSLATGKSADGDLARRKKTYPIVWAVERDPNGAGRAVIETYAKPGATLDAASVESLRSLLDSAGAREAAVTAASDCFARALARAAGLKPLETFIESSRAALD